MTDRGDLVDSLPDGVLALDASRCIVVANTAAGNLTGFAPDALVGEQCADLLEPRAKDGTRLWEDGWHRSAGLSSVRCIPEQEIELRRADSHRVRTLVTGRYDRHPGGELAGAVLVLRPADRRTHLLAQGIEVVSVVSHELRSPLTSVKGYTSLLLNRWDRLTDDQKRAMLEQVNHDADRVTRLITELLDISRLEAGRLVLKRQMVDLVALAAKVADNVRHSYPDLDAEVRFPATFPKIYADADKLEQVVTNLIENAAKYASPVGITVTGAATDGEVTVKVSDRGEGIPDESRRHVFDKFFRAPDTKPTGSGLGLWISRGLVEAHGGRLTVDSNSGRGSVFSFSLPLKSFEELHG